MNARSNIKCPNCEKLFNFNTVAWWMGVKCPYCQHKWIWKIIELLTVVKKRSEPIIIIALIGTMPTSRLRIKYRRNNKPLKLRETFEAMDTITFDDVRPANRAYYWNKYMVTEVVNSDGQYFYRVIKITK